MRNAEIVKDLTPLIGTLDIDTILGALKAARDKIGGVEQDSPRAEGIRRIITELELSAYLDWGEILDYVTLIDPEGYELYVDDDPHAEGTLGGVISLMLYPALEHAELI